MSDTVRVLHVEDDPAFADLASTFLEREDERLTVETVLGPDAALDRLATGEYDCVVSDYDMPGRNGLALLSAVRGDHPDLPFILFTGKGSEEVASEAISAGVTDYLQKGGGTDQYAILVNRIVNVVEAARAKRRAARHERVNTLIRAVARRLVEADTVADIERSVCEVLSSSEPYRFAWIGKPDPETGELLPSASAGDAGAYLDEVTITVDDVSGDSTPCGRAARTRTTQFLQDIPSSETPDAYRTAAETHAFASVIALPLVWDEDLFGVLAIYADQRDAFDERERAVLTELADTTAAAIAAVETRQRLAERERERELAWKTRAMDRAPVGISISDPSQPDNPLIYVNERFEALTGYDAADVRGRNCRFLQGEATDPESVATLRDAIDRREPVTVDIRNYRKDGTEFWNRVTVAPVEDTTGTVTHFIGFQRDVTEERAADRERRNVLERMSDGFVALDAEWRITHVNEMGRRILSEAAGRDWDADDLRGRDVWEEVPDAVDTPFYDWCHRAMETQEPVSFEEYYEPLDVWFDMRVYPSETGLSIYFYDVTEQRRQREALETRERVLRETYEIVADRDRSFREQVQALLDLGRTELGTAYGTLSRIDGDDYVFEVVSAADDSIEAGDVVPLSATNCEIAASTERTLVLGDVARDAPEETDRAGYTEWGIACYIGAPVYVGDDVYGTFCFYDTEPREGQFADWEVTLTDLMSRWVSYELQRRQATEQLQRQNEKLDRVASVVSHDLRNPLEVLRGSLELAEETGEAEHFERCHTALERMGTLVEDLPALARAGRVVDEPVPVDLPALVTASWQTVATGDATLVVDTELTISADESRLRQLLENLFRNCVEHAEDDVTITVGDLPDRTGFSVEDDGPGIPPDDRDAVFEYGYSTGSEGSGFGLAIVREIAEAHGWEVTVVDGSAGGARFEITGVAVDEEEPGDADEAIPG
ncbi:GAF domain-containing protein [Salinigranum salinum]|uniref:GAF domain-containing protein n=1 Tax=Salinigranum salinum TaxID=1364937 RepID=UPI0018655F05|nr:GAF domain-containing protein [Salinigranum salinum]